MKKLAFTLMLASLSFIAAQEASAGKTIVKEESKENNGIRKRKPVKRQLFKADDQAQQLQTLLRRARAVAQTRDDENNQ